VAHQGVTTGRRWRRAPVAAAPTTVPPAAAATPAYVAPVTRRPGLLWLGGLVALCSWLVALAIGAAIGLQVWDHGAISQLQTVARWLVAPFNGIWGGTWHGLNALIANWGTAAAVYLVGGHLIAGILRRLSIRRTAVPAYPAATQPVAMQEPPVVP
jgi:hypothetical protein